MDNARLFLTFLAIGVGLHIPRKLMLLLIVMLLLGPKLAKWSGKGEHK